MAETALAGRTALVCGATGAIGAPIARRLANAGARVVVHGNHNLERAEEIAAELGSGHLAFTGDLTDPDIAEDIARRAAPITILVNAAFPHILPRRFADSDPKDLEANLDGVRMHVNICRVVLPAMRQAGFGRIVLLSGALSERPYPGFSFYTTAKAALTAFSRALALEEGAAGVTVNVVAPGEVASESDDAGSLPEPFAGLDQLIRLRSALPLPTAEDVAATVAFLASPETGAVTGQVIYLASGEPI